MLHFENDYHCGAHPAVLEALVNNNMSDLPGYGLDPVTDEARTLILKACGLSDKTGRPERSDPVCNPAVHFLIGGTQTNATVIDAVLRPGFGVIAAPLSHINVHESGAIEAAGHKVITLEAACGKLTAETVDRYMTEFYADPTWPHMVIPGMVYITFPTELGTLYSLAELEALSVVCRRYGLLLYADGARLGYALASPACDVTLPCLARLTDVFYIGGTKCGAMFGEAVVARDGSILGNFFNTTKRHGALLAKGWLPGLQFRALFTDSLYTEICRPAVEYALEIRRALEAAGYRAEIDSMTNQQFFRIPNGMLDRLHRHACIDLWGSRGEESSAIRIVTSWSTTAEDTATLIALLQSPSPHREAIQSL